MGEWPNRRRSGRWVAVLAAAASSFSTAATARFRKRAEAARFGEMVRNNPAMLARFRAARAVDATTDDDAVAIIRSATAEAEAHQAAARAAIELLRARGVGGIPLQEDNARIDRFVAEFGVPPPQI